MLTGRTGQCHLDLGEMIRTLQEIRCDHGGFCDHSGSPVLSGSFWTGFLQLAIKGRRLGHRCGCLPVLIANGPGHLVGRDEWFREQALQPLSRAADVETN